MVSIMIDHAHIKKEATVVTYFNITATSYNLILSNIASDELSAFARELLK